MGRVSKYKKFKACDPFAKSKTPGDTSKDEPPEIFDKKQEDKWKRLSNRYEEKEFQESLIQKEAIRMIKKEERSRTSSAAKKVDAKKDTETMKEFKNRVRRETTTSLNEELPKMTVSAKRRKRKLIERSNMKKLKNHTKKNPHEFVEKDEVMEFSMSEKGHLRPSDLGSSSSFKKREEVQFGEVGDRPPDLTTFSKMLSKDIDKMKTKKCKENDKRKQEYESRDHGSDAQEEERENGDAFQSSKKKKVKITDRDDLFGSDGLEQQDTVRGDMQGTSRTRDLNNYGVLLTKKNKPKQKKLSVKNQEDMETLRNQVQAQYKKLQEKRRESRNYS